MIIGVNEVVSGIVFYTYEKNWKVVYNNNDGDDVEKATNLSIKYTILQRGKN